jgi:hypothetical protein
LRVTVLKKAAQLPPKTALHRQILGQKTRENKAQVPLKQNGGIMKNCLFLGAEENLKP